MNVKFICLSVVGGWRTAAVDNFDGTIIAEIGPVFRNSPDLWKWQRENLKMY